MKYHTDTALHLTIERGFMRAQKEEGINEYSHTQKQHNTQTHSHSHTHTTVNHGNGTIETCQQERQSCGEPSEYMHNSTIKLHMSQNVKN